VADAGAAAAQRSAGLRAAYRLHTHASMPKHVDVRMMRALFAALFVFATSLGAGCGETCNPIVLCEEQCVPPGHSHSGCYTDATLGLGSDQVACDWTCSCTPCDESFDMRSPLPLDMSMRD
jgi:hypothetical protein